MSSVKGSNVLQTLSPSKVLTSIQIREIWVRQPASESKKLLAKTLTINILGKQTVTEEES